MTRERECWYRVSTHTKQPWEAGVFQCWGQSYEEFECGPGNFMAATIVDKETLLAVVVPADGCVCFATLPPA